MNKAGTRENPPDAIQRISTAFVFTVAAGGVFVPELGLAPAALMMAAIVLTLIKPRPFCSDVCPQGKTVAARTASDALNPPKTEFLTIIYRRS